MYQVTLAAPPRVHIIIPRRYYRYDVHFVFCLEPEANAEKLRGFDVIDMPRDSGGYSSPLNCARTVEFTTGVLMKLER